MTHNKPLTLDDVLDNVINTIKKTNAHDNDQRTRLEKITNILENKKFKPSIPSTAPQYIPKKNKTPIQPKRNIIPPKKAKKRFLYTNPFLKTAYALGVIALGTFTLYSDTLSKKLITYKSPTELSKKFQTPEILVKDRKQIKISELQIIDKKSQINEPTSKINITYGKFITETLDNYKGNHLTLK